MNEKLIHKIFLSLGFLLLTLVTNGRASAQETINFSTGVGIPQLLNAGIRFQAKQTQIGFFIGTFPVNDEDILTVGGDIYLHFGGFSQYSERRPWYFKGGLSYLRDESETIIDKFVYLNTCIGRDVNLSPKFGINVELGASISLDYQRIEKVETNSWFNFNINPPVIPSLSLGLFYRI